MGFPETFKALSDPARREILMMLKGGSMSAGEIGKRFEMTGATISYHLAQLKKAELVYETRHKNFIYYSLNLSIFEEIMVWTAQFMKQGDDARDGVLNDENSDAGGDERVEEIEGERERKAKGVREKEGNLKI